LQNHDTKNDINSTPSSPITILSCFHNTKD
jgi:hypothetical protein